MSTGAKLSLVALLAVIALAWGLVATTPDVRRPVVPTSASSEPEPEPVPEPEPEPAPAPPPKPVAVPKPQPAPTPTMPQKCAGRTRWVGLAQVLRGMLATRACVTPR